MNGERRYAPIRHADRWHVWDRQTGRSVYGNVHDCWIAHDLADHLNETARLLQQGKEDPHAQ